MRALLFPTRAGIVVLACLTCFCAIDPSGAGAPKSAKPRFTNRLAKETSPYLLMHAHNPTDWYPWGPEAFAKARKENKLVFLSIGYSSCYWCHVMERESFNNEEVAKLLNASFVCIKVDREERPDIDHIYMTALNTLNQRGGWPLSMFLTPEGKPIVGGTYWPPDDKVVEGEKSLGFKSVLKILRDAWKDDPKGVAAQAEKLADNAARAIENAGKFLVLVDLDRKLVKETVAGLGEEFDKEYGGFGNPERKFRGPKFPVPCRLDLLLDHGQRTKSDDILAMATFTLDKMARGGIYDQLGGGFHRYSTERTWTVPHFEKMLYDNAQLAATYARAYRISKKPLYRRIVEETLAYVEREMMSPEGAFYSSQDAETHHEEGRFYVWTLEELSAALPRKEDLSLVRKIYGMAGAANFEGKYYILTLTKSLAEHAKDLKLSEDELGRRLAGVKQKLFDARAKRDKPFLNKIALTAWSGLMIAGFAEAGQALAQPKYTAIAARAADFILKHQRAKDDRLLRTYGGQPGQPAKAQGNAYLEDYAFLIHGLLTLHDATGQKNWLDEAQRLTDAMIEHYGDKKFGGFYFTAHDHEKLFARAKDQFDSVQPSSNSMAARNLVRLWAKTGDDRYRAEAERTFKAFTFALKSAPTSLCALVHALDLYLDVKELKKK